MNALEMFRLDGAVAIVTGGATGLGLQMATALAEAGAQVVVASRNLQRCQAVVDTLPLQAGQHMALSLDLNDPDAAPALVRAVMAQYGRVDILVNNSAATDVNRPFEELTPERWEGVLRVNLTGALRCAEAVLEPMRAQARGKIINIASVYGIVGVDARLYGGSPEQPMRNFAYTASKGALVNLTRDMAVSWAPYGINVNAISPGMFPVEANMHKWPAGTFERISQRIPLGRTGSDTDLKGAVIFLASAASDYVSGHILVVDGGWLAW
jgi:NAD(P)-dependent dehydrogenase (short-subunit alcohol dehydrogenase family)